MIMKKVAFLLAIFVLHVSASDDTQVGTFNSGVTSKQVKIGKRYKAPIKDAKSYKIDINDSEIEGISSKIDEPKEKEKIVEKAEVKKENVIVEEKDTKIIVKKEIKSEVTQKDGGGVVLPFDRVDEKSGVVLPMDKKEKGGFFSIFDF